MSFLLFLVVSDFWLQNKLTQHHIFDCMLNICILYYTVRSCV